MALPTERDITLYRGDVYDHEFTFVDSASVAFNLSAYTVAAQWRTKQDATTAVDFTVDDTDAATGVIVISLTAAQTTALATRGVYDLQITNENAATPYEPITLVRGTVTLTKDVTRP